jgi:hypothetical protein
VDAAFHAAQRSSASGLPIAVSTRWL